jgi:hypothetical protein
MLDRSGVQELAIASGLGEVVERILAAVRPGWQLDLDPDGDPYRLGCSKIGGEPDLASDEVWPVSALGARMVFLAQIDCSRLPPPPAAWPDPHPWPHGGALIRVFAKFSTHLRSGSSSPAGSRCGWQLHHLLGEPCSIQDGVRTLPAIMTTDHDAARQWEITPDPALGTPDAWRTLMALHFDERIELYLGDGGALRIMVPVADLAANRVDRLVCDFSSG